MLGDVIIETFQNIKNIKNRFVVEAIFKRHTITMGIYDDYYEDKTIQNLTSNAYNICKKYNFPSGTTRDYKYKLSNNKLYYEEDLNDISDNKYYLIISNSYYDNNKEYIECSYEEYYIVKIVINLIFFPLNIYKKNIILTIKNL